MLADPHPRQSERLQALYSYNILDTASEQDFDEIVWLAADVCDTPTSLISLVDADRQWFKARVGMEESGMPLTSSLCAHAIYEEGFVEIEDTTADPRSADNPLVHGDPPLRFYAGVPLMTDDGLPLGTLCVIDRKPRKLTDKQREALRVLARQVIVQLELRKALRTAQMLRQEVDHRVKNSLQSLSSLARLQERTLKTDEARSAVASLKNRLDAVATLHEHLYKTEAGATLNLAVYLRSLCDHLRKLAPAGVTLELDAQPATVSTQQAVSVGTLVNEFVANSYKHAFPGRATGTIRVSVGMGAEGFVEVACGDDGVGLPPDAGGERSGLGMKIAEVATMELQCTLEMHNDPETGGAVSRFRFKPQDFIQRG